MTDRGTGRAGRHARGGDCRLAWRLLVSHRTEGWGGVGGVCGVCVCVCVCVGGWVGGGLGALDGEGRAGQKGEPGRGRNKTYKGGEGEGGARERMSGQGGGCLGSKEGLKLGGGAGKRCCVIVHYQAAVSRQTSGRLPLGAHTGRSRPAAQRTCSARGHAHTGRGPDARRAAGAGRRRVRGTSDAAAAKLSKLQVEGGGIQQAAVPGGPRRRRMLQQPWLLRRWRRHAEAILLHRRRRGGQRRWQQLRRMLLEQRTRQHHPLLTVHWLLLVLLVLHVLVLLLVPLRRGQGKLCVLLGRGQGKLWLLVQVRRRALLLVLLRLLLGWRRPHHIRRAWCAAWQHRRAHGLLLHAAKRRRIKAERQRLAARRRRRRHRRRGRYSLCVLHANRLGSRLCDRRRDRVLLYCGGPGRGAGSLLVAPAGSMSGAGWVAKLGNMTSQGGRGQAARAGTGRAAQCRQHRAGRKQAAQAVLKKPRGWPALVAQTSMQHTTSHGAPALVVPLQRLPARPLAPLKLCTPRREGTEVRRARE